MQKIILFTSSISVEKYWTTSLKDRYTTIIINTLDNLIDFLQKSDEKFLLMFDELNAEDIHKSLIQIVKFSSIKILVFHNYPEVEHAKKMINSGIYGYENTYIAKENLLKMLQGIENGNRWFFKDLTHFIINQYVNLTSKSEPDFFVRLTQKEKEISTMIANGLTNKEIASKENIALSTVKGHLSHIFEKANVTDRVTLALKFR